MRHGGVKRGLSPVFLGKWEQTTFRKHSENVVCPRYLSDVITQFRDRYPKIQLNVFTVEN